MQISYHVLENVHIFMAGFHLKHGDVPKDGTRGNKTRTSLDNFWSVCVGGAFFYEIICI